MQLHLVITATTTSAIEVRELFAGNGMIGYVAKERVDGKLILVKSYLRVDSSDEDEFITQLMETAKTLVCDVSRKTENELEEYGKVVDTAELFVIAYLYEHREEADHKQLVNTVKHLLFSVRKEAF